MSLREEEQVRQLSDYIVIVRRRFWLIALITAVALGAAAAYTFTREPVYRSSMKVLVAQGEGVFRSDLINATETLTQTASDLLESDIVASTVIDELGLEISSTELLGNLGVKTEPLTAVLEVTYDDTSRERGLETLEEVGDTFEQLVETELTTGGNTSRLSAKTADPAHSLPGQVSPKPIRDMAVAGILGLLLGLLAAFLREQFDKTIRSVERAEAAFGQSVSGTLPPRLLGFKPFAVKGKRRRSKHLDPVLADLALQRLRANVFWSWEAGQNRTVVVTSAHPEEGKTTVAVNLAVSMAAEGRDVILVDSDLRRPMVHAYVNLNVGAGTKGLDAIGREEVSIEDALIEVPLDHSLLGSPTARSRMQAGNEDQTPGRARLRVIPAAPGHTLPAEFTVDRAMEIVEELRSKADYVIFDAPPILVVTDSYPLVVAADSVIAIVRNGRSTTTATTALGKTLARLRLRHVRTAELVVTEIETDVDAGRYSYYSAAEAPPEASRRPPAPPPRERASEEL